MGECFFWYWLNWVVPAKGRKTVVVVVVVVVFSICVSNVQPATVAGQFLRMHYGHQLNHLSHTTMQQSSHLLLWDAAFPPLKYCPFPWGDHHPIYLCHPFGSSRPPLQTASRSNQPFFHNTPERQTDRWDRRRHLYQYPLTLY